MPGGESTLRLRCQWSLAFGCAEQCEAHQKWCASYRQYTLPHRRAASRSKPPNPAPEAKLAVVRIQADCLAANPVACQGSLAFGCAERCEAHQKWCASYRQHTLPHRRAASRSKPPKTATGTKLAVVRIQADCLAANPPYGCDANGVLPSDVPNSVKRIKNGALPIVSTPYRIVGRLREASRQKPARGAGYITHPKRLTYFRRICC
nr:hypothetical protein [Methylomarinum sp. Ch1-1]MDP4520803.1 hypothetical protein [Methylomarinum sp. Ch1-1]